MTRETYLSICFGFPLLFSFICGLLNFIEDLNERVLKQDNLILTLPLLEKTFALSFKVKPKSYQSGLYQSVVHLSIGSNTGNDGDRIPGIWFHPDSLGMLRISSSVNGNYDYTIYTTPFTLNKWTSIRISQFQKNEVYTYAVYINGDNVHSINNTLPRAYSLVKVYAGDPWGPAQDGLIKDFRIINGNEEMCGVLVKLFGSLLQNGEIHLNLMLTTSCLCYIQNVSINLQPESSLMLRGFLWDELSLNESFVKKDGNNILVQLGTLSSSSYASFSAVFVYGKNIPDRIINISMAYYSRWSCCYGDLVYKVNSQVIAVPIKLIPTAVKMDPIWTYKQPNGTLLQTEAYQFLCSTMQKRQISPCYQRELSTGMIMFLPINVLDVFGYNSITAYIYGRTLRNNVIQMDLNKRTLMIITKEKCSQIKSCTPYFNEI